jgi:hypothetical protein
MIKVVEPLLPMHARENYTSKATDPFGPIPRPFFASWPKPKRGPETGGQKNLFANSSLSKITTTLSLSLSLSRSLSLSLSLSFSLSLSLSLACSLVHHLLDLYKPSNCLHSTLRVAPIGKRNQAFYDFIFQLATATGCNRPIWSVCFCQAVLILIA